MYKIRLSGKDRRNYNNGCKFSWVYEQKLIESVNVKTYKVDVSIQYVENMHIVTVKHFNVAGNHESVIYEFLTYDKARKYLSTLNKFYS